MQLEINVRHNDLHTIKTFPSMDFKGILCFLQFVRVC